jgi:hypothetical protein
MDDFLSGYYGAAAMPIRKYIDAMHDALEKSGAGLAIFGGPGRQRNGYLSEDMCRKYDSLFDEAERLAERELADTRRRDARERRSRDR